MTENQRLTLATPDDIASTLAFALQFQGKKRKHDADDFMANIVARRLVEHLEQAGFVIMKKPPSEGAGPLGRGPGGK